MYIKASKVNTKVNTYSQETYVLGTLDIGNSTDVDARFYIIIVRPSKLYCT